MAGKKPKSGKRFKLEKPDKPVAVAAGMVDDEDADGETQAAYKGAGIITVLTNAARAVRTDLSSALGRLGLYAGQEQIILALSERPGCTLGELAEAIGVRPPTVTKAITRLEARGFVKRIASSQDARVVMVRLTERGDAIAEDLRAVVADIELRLLGDLKKSERKALLKGLSTLADSPARG